jgi:hypothetical protein
MAAEKRDAAEEERMKVTRGTEKVEIEMSVAEYHQLLMAMGYAAAAARERDDGASQLVIDLTNSLIMAEGQ